MSDRTEALNKMLDDLMNDKGEQAEIHFHDYLKSKMADIVHGDNADVESDEDASKNEE